jgi:Tn3 transposase DDE domain/Domain of unknown function (DUF1957)
MMHAQNTQSYAESRVKEHLENMKRIAAQVDNRSVEVEWLNALCDKDNIFGHMDLFELYRGLYWRKGERDIILGSVLVLLDEAKLLNRGESYHQLSSTIAKVSGGRMLSGKTEIELDINAESIRLIANAVIFYNATLLSTLYQHYQAVDPEMAKVILRLSPLPGSISTSLASMNFTTEEMFLIFKRLSKTLSPVLKSIFRL